MFVRPLGQKFPRYRQWHSEVIYASNNIKKIHYVIFNIIRQTYGSGRSTEKNAYHKIFEICMGFSYLMNNSIFTVFII